MFMEKDKILIGIIKELLKFLKQVKENNKINVKGSVDRFRDLIM